jgi:hypothetical protein
MGIKELESNGNETVMVCLEYYRGILVCMEVSGKA